MSTDNNLSELIRVVTNHVSRLVPIFDEGTQMHSMGTGW